MKINVHYLLDIRADYLYIVFITIKEMVATMNYPTYGTLRTNAEIDAALYADGYVLPYGSRNRIRLAMKRADKVGCLVWTRKHIISTKSGDRLEFHPGERGICLLNGIEAR